MTSRFTYRRMTPAAFLKATNRLDLSHKAFARIFGVPPGTVTDWAYGRREIALWVPVALALLEQPGALVIARSTAADYIAEDNLTGEAQPYIAAEHRDAGG